MATGRWVIARAASRSINRAAAVSGIVACNRTIARSDGLTDVTVFNLFVFGASWGRWGFGPVMQLLPARGNGWALSSGEMQLTMDWERGGLVNVPFGVQLSKVTSLAGQPVKYALNPEYNARSIDGAPRWQVRFTFTVLAPAK